MIRTRIPIFSCPLAMGYSDYNTVRCVNNLYALLGPDKTYVHMLDQSIYLHDSN